MIVLRKPVAGLSCSSWLIGTVVVITVAFALLSACSVAPTPPVLWRPLVSVVGDSYTGGSSMDSGTPNRWTTLMEKRADVRVQILAVGGSGYITVNSAATSKTTFVQRAALVDPKATEVVFFGSRNDTDGDIRAAAVEAVSTVRRRAPSATVILIGPAWVDDHAPVLLRTHRDDLERAAAETGADFVDPIAERWFPDGSGLIGSDRVHPTDAGHEHLAQLIVPIIVDHLPA